MKLSELWPIYQRDRTIARYSPHTIKAHKTQFNLLIEYMEFRKDEDVALFVTERAPHRMSIAEMRYILKRIAKRSGICNNVYPHKLRHTYATHLLNNGASIEAIRQLMGHSNMNSTLIYAHLTEEGKQNTYSRCFKG